MAATAVYSVLAQVSRGDGKVFLDTPVTSSNINASTSNFTLSGGKYVWTVKGSTFGTVTLQQLAGDGSTFLDVKQLSANGVNALDLAPGTYKIVLA